jgi:hypothetical protein
MKKIILAIIGILFFSNVFSQQYVLYINGSKTKSVFKTEKDCKERIKDILSDKGSGMKMPTELSSPDGSTKVSVSSRDVSDLRKKLIEKRNEACKCECKEIKESSKESGYASTGESTNDFSAVIEKISENNAELKNKNSQWETTEGLNAGRSTPNMGGKKSDDYLNIIQKEKKNVKIDESNGDCGNY